MSGNLKLVGPEFEALLKALGAVAFRSRAWVQDVEELRFPIDEDVEALSRGAGNVERPFTGASKEELSQRKVQCELRIYLTWVQISQCYSSKATLEGLRHEHDCDQRV